MGVQGLWELLAPVGRRVSVETLAGKKLAIDASIWMIQFMKAMRDERGEMVRNAHILGFFRRICKLLFLRTKPIFVFDGGTPALKRRTVAARRRHRENARAKIRKTAEKLLLNHLKAKKLEELAAEIKNNRRKDESKGKQVAVDDGRGAEGRNLGNGDQERLDELLAASLAVEEEGTFTTKDLTSASNVIAEEGVDGDENEEMLFPVMKGNIDPAVLASLPPSMQLDLLVQMRERLMAENRQKYQKIKKAPTKFSELQIQSYLKTVAFRREIDEVQKCAAGKGLGGVQTSRIASEANREFIFSSSFTGDKQMLSNGIGRNKDANHTAQDKATSSDPIVTKSVPMKSNSVMGSCVGEPISDFVNDVETYLDERGRLRVSRVRGMGIHMTRDLQRNLDMMKEYEQGKNVGNICKHPMLNANKRDSEATKVACRMSHPTKASSSHDDGENMSRGSMVPDEDVAYQFDVPAVCPSKATIEISFLEDEALNQDEDENLFYQLVSGSSAWESHVARTPIGMLSHDSESDCDWEEGIIVDKTGNLKGNIKEQSQPSLAEQVIGEEGEVDWEEGTCQAPDDTALDLAEYDRHVLRGHILRGVLDEEADIHEAIRRSLEDFGIQKPLTKSSENQQADIHLQLEKYPKVSEPGQLSYASREDIVLAADSLENHLWAPAGTKSPLLSRDSPQGQLLSPAIPEVNCEWTPNVMKVKNKNLLMSDTEINRQSVINSGSTETLDTDNVPMTKSAEGQLTFDKEFMDPLKQGVDETCFRLSVETEANSDISMENKCELPDFIFSNNHDADLHASQESDILEQKYENSNSQDNASVKSIENGLVGMDLEQQTGTKISNDIPTTEAENYKYASTSQDNTSDQLEFTQASMDEEIALLRQERIDLSDEQRKLERNAESVSSEMFAECQELLQMFGLPYIIAPMEAEAQCAFMEMTKQVDGVITDDSDVLLFGARNVYKNIFDDKKYVETYFMKDIEIELGLTREKLIRMALLLGSDYTEGISGIGIVNAIEVVHAFPEEDGLQKFRAWLESPDPSILGQFDSDIGCKSKKRSSESSDGDADAILDDHERSAREECHKSKDHDPAADEIPDVKTVFMKKHRKVSKNWHIPSSFPSDSVVSAYVSPQVDESLESFQWGKPDLLLLRKICWEKFGWNNQKADELLLPVLKEYNKHETQLRLEAFYSFNERFAKVRSQRIKKAIKGITGSCSAELTDYVPREGSNSKPSKRKRLSPAGAENPKSKSCSNGGINCEENSSNPPQTDDGIGASSTSNYGGESAKSGRMSGYGARGRGNGSGRGRGGKRGEQRPNIQFLETSDDSDGPRDSEKHNNPEDALQLRRSLRQRKHVRYAEDCCEDEAARDSNTTIVPRKPAKDSSTAHDDSSGLNKDLAENQDSVADNPSKDYLHTGGGFCADESNQNIDAFGDAIPVMDSVELFSLDPSNSEQIMDQGSLSAQGDPKIQHIQEHSAVQIDHLYPEQAAGVVESESTLRAMPSLKRKRRKT